MRKPFKPIDKFALRAKIEGYRARSVYKFKELDRRFQLLNLGDKVLDIGAAPGSWLQFTSRRIGLDGEGVGLDLQPIKTVAGNIETFEVDILDRQATEKVLKYVEIPEYDLIVSDVAPNTTGIPYVDQLKSIELSQAVFEISQKYLRPHGRLVMKVFPGEDFAKFIETLKDHFASVKVVRVLATRGSSREVYLVCKS